VGSKKIIEDASLQPVLDRLQAPPDVLGPRDVLWKHRRDGNTDIYFLANQAPASRTETISFRVKDRAPELWWPEKSPPAPGRLQMRERPRASADSFWPHDVGFFVVFRETGGRRSDCPSCPRRKARVRLDRAAAGQRRDRAAD